MSENCGNPNCPSHGNSPRAKADRELEGRVKANHELMGILRILAGNVHERIAEDAGQAQNPLTTMMQKKILMGDYDRDAIVQGLIAGFVVLLREHRPTQQFAGLCADVPEKDNYLENIREGARRKATEGHMSGPLGGMMFGNTDELIAFLKSLG